MNALRPLFDSPLALRLGWTILHSLWQGAAVALALLAVLTVLRRRDPRWRYAAASAAMLLMAAFPLATFFAIHVAPPVTVELAAAVPARVVTPTESLPVEQNPLTGPPSRPMELDRIARPSGVAEPSPVARNVVPPARALLAVSLRHGFDAAAHWLPNALPWLAAAWFLGVAALSVWNLGGWVSVQRLKTMTSRPTDASVQASARRLANRLNVRRAVDVLESAIVRSPVVIGVLKPVILLPLSVLSELSVAQLESILAHELAHIRRHDYLVNLLQTLAETLLFYHPATWWISRRMRAEREHCCDDLAIAVTRDRKTYVQALAAVAGRATGILAPAATGGPLLARVRRIVGIPDDARRAPRWLAGAAPLALCVVTIIAVTAPAGRTQQTLAQPTTRPSTQSSTQPARREVVVKFVDAKTGKPVTGVKGNYWVEPQTSGNDKLYTSDDSGHVTMSIEAKAKSLAFFFHGAGYVEGLMHLGGEFGGGDVPDSYTLRLAPGLTIGGIVHDDQGQPVPDVRVQLTFDYVDADRPDRQSIAYGSAQTDAEGRWTFGGAPASPSRIDVFTKHPDFILDSFRHSYATGQFQSLVRKDLVSIIRHGVTIAGTVTDENGKPIAKTEVGPDRLGLISSTTADDNGHFELRGVEPGPRHILAHAPGFAPQLVDLDAKPGLPPLTIKLEKGRTIRGRVIDSHGKPVPNAYVGVDKWRTVLGLNLGVRSDSDGRFVWNEAPEDEVTFVGSTRATQDRIHVTAVAGGPDVLITLPTPITLRGTVVDEVTGKPIDQFSIHISVQKGATGWSMDRQGAKGAYELTAVESAERVQIRISAAGYLPVDSPDLVVKDDEVRFDVRLKTGGGVTGNVLAPHGKPAAGADVVLIEKGAATVEDGVLSSWAKTANVSSTTDAAGRFTLPARTGPIKVMLFHDSGWNLLKQDAGASLENQKLRAWCTVEGVLMKESHPWAGQTVEIRPTTKSGDPIYERQFFRYQIVTDAQGRFAFKNVVDGTSELGVQIIVPMEDGRNSYVMSHSIPLDLKPGENKKGLRIGGVGRPVIGHVVVGDDMRAKGLLPVDASLSLARPPGFVTPPNWDQLSPEQKQTLRDEHAQTEASRKYAGSVKSIVGLVRPDGTVRFEDVPAGQYTFHVGVLRPSPTDPSFHRSEASAQKEFTLDEMPGGRSDDPLDIGSVTLGEVRRPEAGQAFPDFHPATFDGKKMDFADYRGKYVLVDFWATWCGPCIAELKHMQSLRDKYATDPRFVILGVSVDDRLDEPAKFLQGRKLPWPQAFAGTTAWPMFGIGGIPSVWLVGPDGKIIAKEIPEERLDEVIEKALSAR